MPIDDHGFFLQKGYFRDALCLKYGWQISNLPLHCACGDPHSVDHVLCCHKHGFPTLHHNEICNMCAQTRALNLAYNHSTMKHSNYAQPIRTTRREWTFEKKGSGLQHKWHFFTLGYFTLVPHRTETIKELSAGYRLHENAKKHEYGARIHEVERGAFTPLVLSTTGRMARGYTVSTSVWLTARLTNVRQTSP